LDRCEHRSTITDGGRIVRRTKDCRLAQAINNKIGQRTIISSV
jgi:hypothetical protein